MCTLLSCIAKSAGVHVDVTFDSLPAERARDSAACREHVVATLLADRVAAGLKQCIASAIHADLALNTRLHVTQLIAQLLHLHAHKRVQVSYCSTRFTLHHYTVTVSIIVVLSIINILYM